MTVVEVSGMVVVTVVKTEVENVDNITPLVRSVGSILSGAATPKGLFMI